jgi:hypothetical protein
MALREAMTGLGRATLRLGGGAIVLRGEMMALQEGTTVFGGGTAELRGGTLALAIVMPSGWRRRPLRRHLGAQDGQRQTGNPQPLPPTTPTPVPWPPPAHNGHLASGWPSCPSRFSAARAMARRDCRACGTRSAVDQGRSGDWKTGAASGRCSANCPQIGLLPTLGFPGISGSDAELNRHSAKRRSDREAFYSMNANYRPRLYKNLVCVGSCARNFLFPIAFPIIAGLPLR